MKSPRSSASVPALILRAEDFELDAVFRIGMDLRDHHAFTAWSTPAPRDLRRQFVTGKRWIAFACPLEHLKRLLEIAAGGAFGEILLGAQRRHLLRTRSHFLHATFLDLPGLTTSRTPTPRRASMSIKASVLNRSMRPRRRSLTRGCVTRSTLRGLGLCEPSRRDRLLHLNQQVSTDEEVL